jgi:hypothetical protein
MQEYHGWSLPAGGQSPQGYAPENYNTQHVSVTASNNYNAASSSQHQPHYNNYDVVSPQVRPCNAHEAVSPPRPSYNYEVPTPDGQSYGHSNVASPQRNEWNGHFVSTPPQGQPTTNFKVSPLNSDNNHHSSPEISLGSWNVPSPENMTKSTVEGYDNNPFGTMMPSNTSSPVTISPTERPLIRPTVAVGKGYDHIPDLPLRQHNEGKYNRVADIRRESRIRQKKEDSMLRPGQRPVPKGRLENMATSTRQGMLKPPMPNHQTIHAFKYKLDHDREKIAQNKALNLLNMMSS